MRGAIIETERLYFRELTQDDFDAVCRIMQDEETMRAAYEGRYTDDEVRRWIDYKLAHYAKRGFGLWAVILKETGELIGQCGITMQKWKDEETYEIGYLFRRDCWHRGYAVEAATACKQYAFDVLGVERVCSMVRDTNIASQKVAERIGMTVVDREVKNFCGVDMMFLLYELRRSV